MSPVSRKRRPKRSGKPQRRPVAPTSERVHTQLVKAFDAYGTYASPFEAVLYASHLLARWWQAPPEQRPQADELVGLGLVEFAARRATPGAMAVLHSWAAVGATDAQREAAAAGATRLAEAGIADPPWAQRLSQLRVGECWQIGDVYGDQANLLSTFGYGDDGPQHVLLALVDFNGPGLWLKDLFAAADGPAILGKLRAEATSDPLLAATQIAPARARQLLERALSTMDEIRLPSLPGVDDERPEARALAMALCRAMPVPSTVDDATSMSIDQKAVLAEFLASPHARELPQTRETQWCVQLIVDSLMDTDPPLRISPALVEDLMHGLFSEFDDDPKVVPAIVDAWVRWSAERNSLPEAAVTELTEVAARLGERFVHEHKDEGDFWEVGLEQIRDPIEFAEALKRRRFAFKYLDADLDPADEDSRMESILAEHPEYEDVADEEVEGVSPRLHLAMHAIVAKQLWDGDPPEVWPAAKRLLDAGMDRHEVLHRLAALIAERVYATLSGEPPDIAEYRQKLEALGVSR